MLLYIRGIGQGDYVTTVDPGVGTYLNGIYLPRPSPNLLRMPDIERVEVLRGPQGTLFGKNTTGGVISVVTQDPLRQNAGYAKLSTGSYNLIDGQAMLDVPVIEDRLLAKTSFSGISQDGYMHNTVDPTRKLGDNHAFSLRETVLAKVTDFYQITLTADYTAQNQQGAAQRLAGVDSSAIFARLYNLLLVPPGRTTFGPGLVSKAYEESSTAAHRDDLHEWGITLNNRWIFDEARGIALTSLTGYRNSHTSTATDLDSTPLNYAQLQEDTLRQNLSEELRLNGHGFESRLDWVAGLYYGFEKADEAAAVDLAPGLTAALNAFPGPLDGSPLSHPTAPGGPGNPINQAVDLGLLHNIHQTTNNLAGFADATVKLTDIFRLSGGVRYTEDFKSLTTNTVLTDSGAESIPKLTKNNQWGGISGRLGAEQFWVKDFMSYESYSHGFKSGGYNGRPLVTGDVNSYNPEEVNAYEVGAKLQTWKRRLVASAAAFFNEYRELQLTENVIRPDGTFGVLVQNAGKARIFGFELGGALMPVTGLVLNGGLGYLNSAYTSLDQGSGLNIRLNTPLPKAPMWSFNVGAQYTLVINRNVSLVGRVDYAFKSKIYHEVTAPELTAQNAVGLLSARFAASLWSGKYELALSGSNLTNQRYIIGGVTVPAFGVTTVVDGPPIEWRLSAAARF